MSQIEFRQVKHNSDLYRESVELRFEILRKPLNLTFSEKELAEESNQFHFVALVDQKVVGVLVLVRHEDKMKMRQVAVSNKMQGMGVGAQMVNQSEVFAISNSAKSIILHARITAKKFYLKLGYSTNHEEFMEVGLPHVKMWKDL